MASVRGREPERMLSDMRSGSLAAFEQFYERYVPLMFRIACKLTGDRMEAEDICHDVFLELLNHPERYDPARGSLEAWLAIRAKCRALDRLRRRRRFAGVSDVRAERVTVAASAESPEDRVVARMQREVLHRALANIPEAQRAAVYGMYYEAKTQRELAEALRRPLGTVKSLIRYGLNSLRKELLAAERLSSERSTERKGSHGNR